MSEQSLAAIVLAGGRGRRLGGVNKPLLHRDGQTLLSRAVWAARSAGAGQIVIVGAQHVDEHDVVVVREDPPYGGPAAALGAGVGALAASVTEVLVLAADLLWPERVVALLRAPVGPDGACLVDRGAHPQWLAGRYRHSALRSALSLQQELAGSSLRAVLGTLRLTLVPDDEGVCQDVDTPADLALLEKMSP